MEIHRLARINSEHRQLEEQLKAELGRSQPNPFLVRELTQRRIQVRHRIFEVECGPVR